MSGRTSIAARKIAKASDFLTVADAARGEWDAVVSLAVSAGINAADAIVVLEGGSFGKDRDHGLAPAALRRLGYGTAANQLAGLLSLKSLAQYSADRCTQNQGEECLKRAQRLLTSATERTSREGGAHD